MARAYCAGIGWRNTLSVLRPPASGRVRMSQTVVKPRTKVRPKTQRPPLHKVILLNDDYTPRECVIAVYARDVAETKAKEGTELGKSKGYPLFFTTEPEE